MNPFDNLLFMRCKNWRLSLPTRLPYILYKIKTFFTQLRLFAIHFCFDNTYLCSLFIFSLLFLTSQTSNIVHLILFSLLSLYCLFPSYYFICSYFLLLSIPKISNVIYCFTFAYIFCSHHFHAFCFYFIYIIFYKLTLAIFLSFSISYPYSRFYVFATSSSPVITFDRIVVAYILYLFLSIR
jgi:hypothetical protein